MTMMAARDSMSTFINDFHQAGFGIIRNAAPPHLAEKLRLRLEQLLPPLATADATPLQRLVPRIVEHDSRSVELITDERLVTALTDVFGVTPHLICSYGHEKAAHTKAHTGAHSDVAHLSGVPHHQSLLMVKAMLALTPVRHNSGATMIFPGSHRTVVESVKSAGHQLLMEPGDMALFHANAWHTATPNLSALKRLSLWFVFAQPWMRVFPGYEHSPALIGQVVPIVESRPHLRNLFGLDDPYATARLSTESVT